MLALKRKRLNAVVLSCVLMCVALSAVWLYRVDPADTLYLPKCIFHVLTGLQCPGCGSQRAIHELLHFRIEAAFSDNALLVISIPFLLLLVLSYILRSRIPGFYARMNSKAVAWTVFAVIIAWWVVRNIFQF